MNWQRAKAIPSLPEKTGRDSNQICRHYPNAAKGNDGIRDMKFAKPEMPLEMPGG
jgi:hypothetical protein